MKRRWSKYLKRFALGVLIVGLAVAISIPLGGKLLTVDSGRHPANAIIVLSGDPGDRALMAIELYEEVQPQWIIISGRQHEDHMRRVMEEHGIPAGKILVEAKSISTFENASNSVALLHERGATNAVVVTSWFHSRRALATFQRAAPELALYSCPTRRATNAPVWPDAEGRRLVLSEYTKLLYYWVVYGVPPWTLARR